MQADLNTAPMNDRDSLFIEKPYRSGLETKDAPVYQYALENSKHPVIRLPYAVSDEDGNILPEGFYTLALSKNHKKLLFIQGSVVKATVNVAKLTEYQYTDEELAAKNKLYSKYEEYMRKGRQRKAKKYLQSFQTAEKREQVRIKAKIEYDTEHTCYVITYETAYKKAYAFIKTLR